MIIKLSVHPLVQVVVILVAAYVLWLGVGRFRSLHLGHQVKFNRRRHVRLGLAALVLVLVGLTGGLITAKGLWHRYLASGLHGYLGLSTVPLILFGLGTGLFLDRVKKPRKVLPLVHGLNNVVLVGLFVALAVSGLDLFFEVIAEY